MIGATETAMAIAMFAYPTLAQYGGGWGPGGGGGAPGSGYPNWGGGNGGSGNGGGGNGNGDGNGNGNGNSNGNGNVNGNLNDNGNGVNSFGFRVGSDFNTVIRQRAAHGLIASLAFVVLFPLGAILLRVIPGRWAVRIHYVIQMLAWLMYMVGFALGIVLLRQIPSRDGWSLLANSSTNAHPIIGIVVFGLVLIQPLLGCIHHRAFKRSPQPSAVSRLHVWEGRATMVLGIINGGLGLRLAGASRPAKLAYTIIAAIFGAAWILVAVLSSLVGGGPKKSIPKGRSRGKAVPTGKRVRVQKPMRREEGSEEGEPERDRP